MTTIGILLAGGESRRFGSPKAFAEESGELFYERAYKALEAVSDQVVIVSHPSLVSRFPENLDTITDLPAVAGQGPLAGILTAMKERPGDRFIILPCDMPFIRPKDTAKLVELMDETQSITAVKTLDELVPLFSIWKAGLEQALEQELADGGRRVMPFMEKAGTAWLDASLINEDLNVFRNINRPD